MSRYAPSRELVVAVCRTLMDRGYLKATEGNVSVRVPGEAAFAITPSSYDYGKMEPDDICILDLDGSQFLGDMKASIEAGMHAAVYAARADVSVIIHDRGELDPRFHRRLGELLAGDPDLQVAGPRWRLTQVYVRRGS